MTQYTPLKLPHDLAFRYEDLHTVVIPKNKAELQALIQWANQSKAAIWPWVGCPKHQIPCVYIDMAQLDQAKSSALGEFLLTAQTGLTVGQVNQLLASYQQRLPLQYAESRPLWSVLNGDAISLTSLPPRALVQSITGIESVTGDGEAIHYGGEVLKNVTGYDMTKLFVGSYGQYGLLTQVTLKTQKQPQAMRSFLFHVEQSEDAFKLFDTFQRGYHHIESLALFKTKTTFGWQILLTLAGLPKGVAVESDAVAEVVKTLNHDLQEMQVATSGLAKWRERLDFTNPLEPDALVIKLVLPDKHLINWLPEALGVEWLRAADWVWVSGTHQLVLRWIQHHMPLEDELLLLKQHLLAQGGFLEILRCPVPNHYMAALLNQNHQPMVVEWEKTLKYQFDPNAVLCRPGWESPTT